MPDLIAQGLQPQHRWRRSLPAGRKLVIGRHGSAWATPWDDRISRQHAELVWNHGRLEVKRVGSARNPIFVEGRQIDSFFLKPGQHFVIGNTTFTLADERVNVSLDAPLPTAEQAYSPEFLRNVRYRDADQRIDVLSKLPELIGGAPSDEELFVRLVNVLLQGITRATAAAIVFTPPSDSNAPITVLHWDRRALSDEAFQPSERLIRQALERKEGVAHVWTTSDDRTGTSYTFGEAADWAFCTPIPGDACRGWAIYVTGRLSPGSAATLDANDPHDLRDDLKFTELAASTLGSVREVRALERKQAGLGQFFSPVVLEAMAGQDPEQVLSPREVDVTVLFCDLRGFSRRSEKSADNLLGLLQRVSGALGVMTRQILDQGGVVGDFHGDSAMGFWGWPIAQDDAVERASRAALAIRAEFTAAAAQPEHPLADFRIGIGVATGRAVAGKIGSVDQVKVTVFGPVVNLASRLEGMTKTLRAPILIDESSAKVLRQRTPPEVARVRKLAIVKPFGLDTPLEVSELLPPAAQYPQLTDEHVAAYEGAVDALQAGDWSKAFELLHRVPADDRAKDFLTVFIAQHNRTPPDDWNGVIPLGGK